jgi:hypothetical protein
MHTLYLLSNANANALHTHDSLLFSILLRDMRYRYILASSVLSKLSAQPLAALAPHLHLLPILYPHPHTTYHIL